MTKGNKKICLNKAESELYVICDVQNSGGGCDQQGKETFGKVIGTILESDLIAFFTKLGTTISAAQETYETWIRDHGEEFAALAAEYTR